MTLQVDSARVPTPIAWQYTTRSEWSTEGESMWMRLSKFSLLNRLSLGELMHLFALVPEQASLLPLLRPQGWKLDAMASLLGITPATVDRGFLHGPRAWASQCEVQLRHCAQCLETGFHAAWFQWHVIERCPLHGAALRVGCPGCGAAIPYALCAGMASSPLKCRGCGMRWIERMHRPAGRCVPLDPGAATLMARWEQTVAYALAGQREPLPPRLNDGRFTVAPPPVSTPRPHVLTLFNRHYSTPPPSTSQLLIERPQAPRSTKPVGSEVNTVLRTVACDPSWPHFGGLFRTCEQHVQRVHHKLLGSCIRRPRTCMGVLANSLVAPAHWIDVRTAAALGWSIAWTTASATLATDRCNLGALPSLGLATWLADIPLRPARMIPAQWQAQVLRWLDDDLALSAWLWSRLAQFMYDHGHFVLRSLVTHPVELAALRVRG